MVFDSKRFQSLTGQEALGVAAETTATLADIEAIKVEILTDVRKEINRAKQEILDGERTVICFVTVWLVVAVKLAFKPPTFFMQLN